MTFVGTASADNKTVRTSMTMATTPKHSKHDSNIPLYPLHSSAVAVHMARNDSMGYQGTRWTDVRSVTTEPAVNWNFGKHSPSTSCLLCPRSSLARVSPDLLARDLSAAVAQGVKAPTLLFRKAFAIDSIECQGKPSSLKSGSLSLVSRDLYRRNVNE
jgi:hypothetical protein